MQCRKDETATLNSTEDKKQTNAATYKNSLDFHTVGVRVADNKYES